MTACRTSLRHENMQETQQRLRIETVKQPFWGQTENLVEGIKTLKSQVDCAKYTFCVVEQSKSFQGV